MKKQIKFNVENSDFNIYDFQNHAIERNLTRKIKGGCGCPFSKITFREVVDQDGTVVN